MFVNRNRSISFTFAGTQRGVAGHWRPAPVALATPRPRTLADVGGPNHFGALRLLFAFLVILSHAPELIDGNRSRELLTGVFNTLSFGEFAVDCFFLVSGYLIVRSYDGRPNLGSFAMRRGLRIVPGYAVAFLVSWLVVGPLAGTRIGADGYMIQVIRLITLQPPELKGAFAGLPYPALNGAMWTIAYEARCYIAAALLGFAGAYRHPIRYLAACGAVLLLVLTMPKLLLPYWLGLAIGDPRQDLAFLMIFLAGGAFHVFRARIVQDGRLALAAAAILAILMSSTPLLAHLGMALGGGYLLFHFALTFPAPRLAGVGNKVDLSYGLYLYAWPVQNLLVQRMDGISPWHLTLGATAVAAVLGYASWRLVEQPCLAFGRRQ